MRPARGFWSRGCANSDTKSTTPSTSPGATDAFWAERATRLRQVIVTQDYDFSQLAETGRAPFGVVQIAPMRGLLGDRVDRVMEAIVQGAGSLIGATTTVETQRVRRRVLGRD